MKNANQANELWPDEKGYLIHIADYHQVDIMSGLEPSHMTRRRFISATAPGCPFPFGQFRLTEEFIIAVMTNFEQNSDSEALLKFVSAIKAQHSREEADQGGVSQSVTVKTGITTVAEAAVPNPVVLRPYVTFPEIANPDRQFIFRIRQKEADQPISCALFSIKSELWKTTVIELIREYFTKAIKEHNITATIIS